MWQDKKKHFMFDLDRCGFHFAVS